MTKTTLRFFAMTTLSASAVGAQSPAVARQRLNAFVGTFRPSQDGGADTSRATWAIRPTMDGMYIELEAHLRVDFRMTIGFDSTSHRYRMSLLDAGTGAFDVYDGDFNASGSLVMQNPHFWRTVLDPSANGLRWYFEHSSDSGATWKPGGGGIGTLTRVPGTPIAVEPDRSTASPRAAPELSRLSYLVGEWTVQNFVRDSTGHFVERPPLSLFRARFLRDGLSIMTEAYEAHADGFVGIHVINFDKERGLIHRYLDAARGQNIEFTGAFNGDSYSVQRRGGYNGKGSFLYRETDSEITPNSFIKRICRSDDDGRTWKEGDYYFRYLRTR